MKQIEEIVNSLEEWQKEKEDGPEKRSYILFCVDGIDGDESTIAVFGETIDLTASIANAMLADKRIDGLIKGATVVCDIKQRYDKKCN